MILRLMRRSSAREEHAHLRAGPVDLTSALIHNGEQRSGLYYDVYLSELASSQ